MKFEDEIKIIDEVYSEMVEAIMNKPNTENFEESRIYFENVAARMNNWVAQLKELRSKLNDREDKEDLSADNRPA